MYAYDKDQLKCQNALGKGKSSCWNHVQVDCSLTRSLFTSWLITHIDDVPGVRDAIVEFALEELSVLRSENDEGGSNRKSEIRRLRCEAENIAKAIRLGGELKSLLNEAQRIDDELDELERADNQASLKCNFVLKLETDEQVDERLDEVCWYLSNNSFGFANLLREVIPVFEIVPVQAFDSGLVRPRVRFIFDIDRLRVESDSHAPIPQVPGQIDLYVRPKHFRFLQECLDLRNENPKLSYQKIAGLICNRLLADCSEDETPDSISYMTVKRCFSVAKLMVSEGLSEPYRVLTKRPKNASRWKNRD